MPKRKRLVGLVASAVPGRDDSITCQLLRCGEEGWFRNAFAPSKPLRILYLAAGLQLGEQIPKDAVKGFPQPVKLSVGNKDRA
jgi:hypothetical protein